MKKNLAFIFGNAKKFKVKFLILFLCIITTSCISSFYPFIFGVLIDEVFYRRNRDLFFIIVLIYGCFYAFEQVLHYILNITWAQLMSKFIFVVRRQIFNKVLTLPPDKLNSNQSGNIMKLINNDAEELLNLIHWNFFYAVADILKLFFSIIIVFFYNYKVAVVLIILIPVKVFVTEYFAKKARIQYGELTLLKSKFASWLFEILYGLVHLRELSSDKNIMIRFTNQLNKIIRIRIFSDKIELGNERVNAFLSLLTNLSYYVLSGILIIKGEFSLGGFVACWIYYSDATKVYSELSQLYIDIQNNIVGIERVKNILDESSEQSNGKEITISKGSVVLNEIFFGYTQDLLIINGVSLNINSGEMIAIVGKSGQGKSTLASLLLSFYKPNSGSIKIDGYEISEFSLESLRRQIGIVWQDHFLFRGTIRNNLLIAKENATEFELWRALEMANLSEFIHTLEFGLDTIIKSNGEGLSGGQKQKIGIARVILRNPKILIFDESTAALDYQSEQAIKSSWSELCKDRTIIIIAHKLSTIKGVDRIAVLSEGKIESIGVIDELITNSPTFKKLYFDQYQESQGWGLS